MSLLPLPSRSISLTVSLLLALLLFACQEEQPVEESQPSLSEIGAFKEQRTKDASFSFDEVQQTYQIKASDQEDLRLLWTPLKGDFMLDLQLPNVQETGTYGLMLCSDLDTKTPIAALQFTDNKLAFMTAAQVNMGNAIEKKVNYIRLERVGKEIIAYYAEKAGRFRPIAMQQIEKDMPVYGGLFAKSTTQDLSFSNFVLVHPRQKNASPRSVISRVEVYDFQTGRRKTILEKAQKIEAPNWHPSGNYLVVNSEGLLYQVDLKAKNKWTPIDTDTLVNCSRHHSILDTNKLVFTNKDSLGARVYSLQLGGTKNIQAIPSKASAFWQDYIEKDSSMLYTAIRSKRRVSNIYRSPMNEAKEVRLTRNRGADFAVDYCKANDMIYLCSTRSGDMKIWETSILGLQRKQLTFDDYQDWSPTVAPDGKTLIFLSYLPETATSGQIQQIVLRSLDLKQASARPEIVFHFYGDHTALSNTAWSPDGTKIAFVSYTFPADRVVMEVKDQTKADI
ncbi:MAG: hypothetical protein AAF847_01365 [Bacteroidota bacterium]